MLFSKFQKSILQQNFFFIKEVYYKQYNLLVIFLKSNKLLADLILQYKTKIYYRHLCIFSKQAKSLSRFFKSPRIAIREMSNKGFFLGLHKGAQLKN